MPRIFANTEELLGAEITLVGEAHHYLSRVLRLGVGAAVDLFDGRGQEVRGTIRRTGSQGVTLELGVRSQRPIPKVAPITLLQGLPRADRMDLIVQKATELGVARLVPVRTQRTAQGQQGRIDRWERIAREAARQCGRADSLGLCEVLPMEAAIAGLPADGGQRLMPWEETPNATGLLNLLSKNTTSVTALVGPEGGFTSDEATFAQSSGFQLASLGPRILRTETAAIAVVSVIQACIGGLGST